ncbi:MAG: TlyA family RNA methyltransferase [Clostridia bacterium]|nr:TlyA family RNA methyltransferase [Clostridia bacterium]
MRADRVRADVLLAERGLAASREKARAVIMSGTVYADGVKLSKSGAMLERDAAIEIRGNALPFASRGGLKLEKAIACHGLNLTGAVAADIGASTGGFTDCMLSQGAAKVYAIDVGYGQLDWKLRNDDRVVVMERTNARNIAPEWFSEALSFAAVDVSFISVNLIVPKLCACMTDGGKIVVLIKPQFEAGRDKVGKHGVVRSVDTHIEVISNVALGVQRAGFALTALDFSPITGPKGNIEFLLIGEKRAGAEVVDGEQLTAMAKAIAAKAHEALSRADREEE